jgi:biotin-dependent carboxylase-like uncharacterized protein
MSIIVHNPGSLTTVQDAGRRGYQRYGVGASGAVDVHSYVYSNILVGNKTTEAVLECTILGPTLEFTSPSIIAVTGGDLTPAVNGVPIQMYRATAMKTGDVLSFMGRRTGCRAYIAFAGGLDIPIVMGSRSTYIKARVGGFHGRKLEIGDELKLREEISDLPNLEYRYMEKQEYTGDNTVRVLMGPQDDMYTDYGIRTFLTTPYTVTKDFDRMGYRLQGKKIELVKDGNIITDGIAFGSIQVPDSGQPIIMISDRQTTGGYGKIANIINVDMPLVAQSIAGDTIRFKKTDIRQAQDLFISQRHLYRKLAEKFDDPRYSHRPVYPVIYRKESGQAAVGVKYDYTVSPIE